MSGNEFILSGPKFISEIPNESLGKCFVERLKKRDKTDVISVDAITKKEQTCEELLKDIIKAYHFFKNEGLQKGDVICLISENVIGYNVPLIAAWCIGVIVNLLNPDYTIGEFRHAFLISKPKMVLCTSKALANVIQLQVEFEWLTKVFPFGNVDDNVPDTLLTFNSKLESIPVDNLSLDYEEFDASEMGAVIMLSSGTTGLPKGALLSHTNLRRILEATCDPRFCDIRPGDTVIAVLPFFHIFGALIYTCVMYTPGKCVVLNRFKPDVFLSTIQDFKVAKLHLVPPLVLFLAKHALVLNYNLSSIKDIMCGGSPLAIELKKDVNERFGDITFRNVYGTTETSGACTVGVNAPNESVGTLLPESQAKVADIVTGETLGPLKTGEICFKGPTVMKGYYGVANNNSIVDKDGFYRSGDIGYYDEDGCFYIVDRIKELIKYKGFQVAPAELENILLGHPAVKECAVVGKPDKRAGQLPTAFVVCQPGVSVNEQELIDYVAERVWINKQLHGGVQFIEEIPKTSSGKNWRRKLEERLRADL